MGTTNLFVELVVIGIGSTIWVLELLIIIFNWKINFIEVSNKLNTIALIPVLAIVYLLGIITDKVSDSIAAKIWGDKCRRKILNDKDYFEAITILEIKSQKSNNAIEYSRSRIRILRGWMFQLVFITIFSTIIIIRNRLVDGFVKVFLFDLFFILTNFLIWFVWIKTQETTFKKIKDQAEFLKYMKL